MKVRNRTKGRGANLEPVTSAPLLAAGPLDQGAADAFRDQLLGWRKRDGDVVVDFSKVDGLCTSSLQVLIALSKDLEPQGRRVLLQGVDGRIRDLFRVSGTDTLFQFAEGVQS